MEKTNSEYEPYMVFHEVVRPVIQEVREIIQPFRRLFQEVRPVVEEVNTVVAKREKRPHGSIEDSRRFQKLITGENHYDLALRNEIFGPVLSGSPQLDSNLTLATHEIIPKH